MYISRAHPNYSVNEVVRRIALEDPVHVPLYHMALNLWIRYTGRDLFTIRLLSLFTGLLAIAFTYRLVRATVHKDTALDAVLIASFLAFFIFYAHQARMYALLALVSAWVLWSYWTSLISANAKMRRRWLSLVASCAALVYTHYFGFILLAAIGIYHLLIAPKNLRWVQICVAAVFVALLFLPWLPYAWSYLQIRNVPASDALALGDALSALLSIYSNGQPLIFAAAAVLVFRFRQLAPSQVYITIICVFVLALLLVANEFTALIIARRIRYTISAGILLICTLAIALNLLPGWNLLRLPFMAVWIALFFMFWRSDELYLYTNQRDQKHNTVPHFQDLLYEPGIDPRRSDFVLSFHRDTLLNENKLLDYYGRKTGNWRGLIHIWNDADGNPVVQSTDARYVDVESMAIWNFPIWLIHNPQETDLQSMKAFADDFSNHFHSCGRFLETDNSIVDLYAKRSIPCELLVSRQPLEIHYENGTELANILLRPLNEDLNIYFWWTNTMASQYAFSLQLFDAQGDMIAQLDDVIGGDALYHKSLNVAELPQAEYAAKLILYDYETGRSQPGAVLDGERRFEREVEIAQIRIGD
ncbi:MAG: glycosyltransferase family 39 protein [Chloroflexi bacterium]|nr:glycosyltransferase family 39 protein [Chloroflexota bacterium]